MIVILAPYINDREYHLLASSPKKSAAIDFPEPIWFQQRHPFITTFFMAKRRKCQKAYYQPLMLKKQLPF